jgi:hypothetical protein
MLSNHYVTDIGVGLFTRISPASQSLEIGVCIIEVLTEIKIFRKFEINSTFLL